MTVVRGLIAGDRANMSESGRRERHRRTSTRSHRPLYSDNCASTGFARRQSDIPGDISPILSIPSLYDCSQHVHVALGAGGDGPPTPPVKYILPTPYAMASAKTWIAPGDCVRHALQRWVLAAQERGQRTLRSTGRPSTSGRRWLQPPGVNQTDSAPWRHPRRCAISPSTILAANESPI